MSPERNVPPGPGPFAPIEREKDILRLGLQAAAQCGDPEPELIEHTIGFLFVARSQVDAVLS
jgi:hypothetical protein